MGEDVEMEKSSRDVGGLTQKENAAPIKLITGSPDGFYEREVKVSMKGRVVLDDILAANFKGVVVRENDEYGDGFQEVLDPRREDHRRDILQALHKSKGHVFYYFTSALGPMYVPVAEASNKARMVDCLNLEIQQRINILEGKTNRPKIEYIREREMAEICKGLQNEFTDIAFWSSHEFVPPLFNRSYPSPQEKTYEADVAIFLFLRDAAAALGLVKYFFTLEYKKKERGEMKELTEKFEINFRFSK